MNVRKNLVLVVGAGICAVLLLVALFFLFRYQGQYREVTRDLKQARTRLGQLNDRKPFPSSKNVEAAEANRDLLQDHFDVIMSNLDRATIPSESIEPAEFAPMLERMLRAIQNKADAQGVALPEEFTYRFEEFARGALPEPRTIDRLVRQLRMVDVISQLLVESRISAIESVERTRFEHEEAEDEFSGRGNARTSTRPIPRAPSTSRAERGGIVPGFGTRGLASVIPAAEPSELYRVERFRIVFSGNESAVWEALNRLLRADLFMVIADLQLTNLGAGLGEKTDVRSMMTTLQNRAGTPGTRRPGVMGQPAPTRRMPGMMEPGSDVAPTVIIPREDRIVAGREQVRAEVTIDVYQFERPSDDGGGER